MRSPWMSYSNKFYDVKRTISIIMQCKAYKHPRKTFNWYWYFAVREELRGKRYGQQILDQLIERYKGQTCVLDMESPYQQPCDNIEQRKRRHEFYLRNGFRDGNYVQFDPKGK